MRERLVAMWRRFVATPYNEDAARLWADVRSRHPRFRVAVLADARIAAENRGEVFDDRSRVAAATSLGRLILGSDAFFALVCYRAKAACQARGVPVLPRLLHVLALRTGQVSIGDPVVVAPGVCLPRGRVIIDGLGTTIGGGVVIGPYVTIGLRDGVFLGPTIGPRVRAHTGAKIIGPVTVGDSAEVGANEVVVSDVPARSRCGVAGGLASAEVTSLAAVAVGR